MLNDLKKMSMSYKQSENFKYFLNRKSIHMSNPESYQKLYKKLPDDFFSIAIDTFTKHFM